MKNKVKKNYVNPSLEVTHIQFNAVFMVSPTAPEPAPGRREPF